MANGPNVNRVSEGTVDHNVASSIKTAPDGSLLFDPDTGEVGYKANGNASMTDVMGRAFAAAGKEPWAKDFASLQQEQGSRVTGRLVLNQNPAYAGVGVDDALPANKPELVFNLKTVCQTALSLFGNDLNKMKTFADTTPAAGSFDATSGHAKVTGRVYTQGRGLPTV